MALHGSYAVSHELPGRFTASGTGLPCRQMERVAAQAKLPGETG